MDWFERAEQELVDAFNNGELTNQEFQAEMRELQDELRAGAEEAAQEAYNNYIGW